MYAVNFSPGDRVTVDGTDTPVMTVMAIDPDNNRVQCKWDKWTGLRQEAWFAAEQLVILEKGNDA